MLYFAKLDINVRRKNKLNKQIMEIKKNKQQQLFIFLAIQNNRKGVLKSS